MKTQNDGVAGRTTPRPQPFPGAAVERAGCVVCFVAAVASVVVVGARMPLAGPEWLGSLLLALTGGCAVLVGWEGVRRRRGVVNLLLAGLVVLGSVASDVFSRGRAMPARYADYVPPTARDRFLEATGPHALMASLMVTAALAVALVVWVFVRTGPSLATSSASRRGHLPRY